MASERRHVFISHHFKDDEWVTKLTDLTSRRGWDVRNSSIRAKPANQMRLDRGEISDRVLKRLLRMKISWAKTVVVLIGSQTHSRPWVNWEIEEANRQGKRIVGIFVRGATNADLPGAFAKYGSALVGWNTDSIVAAVDRGENIFQNPDGTEHEPFATPSRREC
jgi:hypothetical protein